MNKQVVVGVQPALPWPLANSPWWTVPVRAERLAALRIGVAAVLLLDVLFVYLPRVTDFYGQASLGDAAAFRDWRSAPHANWSLVAGLTDSDWLRVAMLLWAGAAACLLVGFASRVSAAIAWALSISFLNFNLYIHNAGDTIRTIALFYLWLSPCGAVWSVDALFRRRGERSAEIYIAPWPLRLLFVQLAVIYFFNGVFKLAGPQWLGGDVLHYVLADPTHSRWSYAQLPFPFWALQFLTWTVLVWEISFPILVALPWARKPALWLGVAFHLGIAVLVELGPFCFYMLCLYLPLVRWEEFRPLQERWNAAASAKGREPIISHALDD